MPSAVRRAGAQAAPAARSGSNTGFVVWGLLALGLVARLIFIGADGFSNDISSFESWSLTLVDHPISQFYANAGFADYPPGYFFVLWVVGHAYHLFVHDDPGYTWLKVAVKLPAILMDLVDGYLIYRIVRRFASLPWAFGAMALYVFNPATIFISAYWGQVDSVAAGFTLAVLLLAINADRAEGQAITYYTVGAWLALAYSILIKPPAVMLIPLLLAFPFATGERAIMWRRLRATGWGVFAALVLAFDVAIAFHPTLNPVEAFRWLYERYAFASGVYPYSSVNAFNLYALVHHFWDPDTVLIPNFAIGGRIIGLPQYAWGVLLLLTAVGLVVSRYVQRRQAIALLEGAMILSLGYFVLSTRMHERYSFNAVTLAIPLIFYRRRYLFAAVILSLTLLGNLAYSLDYLHVMNDKIQGLDAGNLMPWLSRPASLLNVLTFFYLGYVYLGSGADATEWIDFGAVRSRVSTTVRRWFAPIEGVLAMTPRDWTIASLLSAASFLITYVGYRLPAEKIFDEIYYARAGEEYLTHKDIFEFTHPPLTKLVITFSMMLFGGMHGLGDTAAGWRFMNLVVGAVMVLLLYCFAKRILGSTLFASIAASFLLFDGFHFAQSRIATPEITVAFFSLLTVYTFYRYWLASQVRIAPLLDGKVVKTGFGALAAVTVVALVLTYVVAHALTTEVRVIAFLYFELGGYLAVRVFVPYFTKAEPVVSYAEGSTVSAGVLTTPDGGRVPKDPKPLVAGQSTRIEKGALHYRDDDLRIEYARGGNGDVRDAGRRRRVRSRRDDARRRGDFRRASRRAALALAALLERRMRRRFEVERPLRLLRRVGHRVRGRGAAPLGTGDARDRPDGRGAPRAVGQPRRLLARHRRRHDALRRRDGLRALVHSVLLARPHARRSRRSAEADVLVPSQPQGDASVLVGMVAVADLTDSRLVLLSRFPGRPGDAGSACLLRCRDHGAAESHHLVARSRLGAVRRLLGVARTRQGLHAARRRVPVAVAALDRDAAPRVRISLLSESGHHLHRRRGALAAAVDARRTHERDLVVAAPDDDRLSRRRARRVHLLVSGRRRYADHVGCVGRAHVAGARRE